MLAEIESGDLRHRVALDKNDPLAQYERQLGTVEENVDGFVAPALLNRIS